MARLQEAAEAGGAMTPGLAEAAAQSGAPPVGGEAGAGAPPPQPAAAAQGAAPAPEAGAPAAPPPGAGAPPPAADPRMQAGGGGPEGAVMKYTQQADDREQQEYNRAMRAVAKILYVNDKTSNAIVDQIRPDNLVSDTAKVTMLFIRELDRKINMDEAVIAEVTRESVGRIAELAEARHSVEYSASDIEQVTGAAWEGVQSMFGNTDVQGYMQTVQGMAPGDLETLKQNQDQILGNTGG